MIALDKKLARVADACGGSMSPCYTRFGESETLRYTQSNIILVPLNSGTPMPVHLPHSSQGNRRSYRVPVRSAVI